MNAVVIIFTLWIPKKYYNFPRDDESMAVGGYFVRVFMSASTPVNFSPIKFRARQSIYTLKEYATIKLHPKLTDFLLEHAFFSLILF